MLLYVLLAILLVSAASAIVMLVFGHKRNRWLKKVVTWGVVASVILIIFCFVLGDKYSDNVTELKSSYNTLTLYYSTVNNSTNEYVRYDYYEKVTDFNSALKSNQEAADGKWLGWLYPADWDADIAPIDFQLHGDSYIGG